MKHRGAVAAPDVDMRHPLRSAIDLFRSKRWSMGWGVAAVAFALHVAALTLAPISIGQAVLAAGLISFSQCSPSDTSHVVAAFHRRSTSDIRTQVWKLDGDCASSSESVPVRVPGAAERRWDAVRRRGRQRGRDRPNLATLAVAVERDVQRARAAHTPSMPTDDTATLATV